MSRNQFIRNTLSAIHEQLEPASPAQLSSTDLTYDDCDSSVRGAGSGNELHTRSKRSDSITSWSSVSRDLGSLSTPGGHNGGVSPSQVSVQETRINVNPLHIRGWESDMENLLKVKDILLMNESFLDIVL